MTAESPSGVQACRLPFGYDSQLDLRLAADRLIAFCGQPSGEVVSAPRQAVSAALSAPIGFPPLIDATVPGDHVVIAVDRGLPQAPAIVAGIIDSLASGRIDPSDIRVVLASGFVGAEEITKLLPGEVGKAITIEQHNARDKDHLSYLAASRDGKPICFNRAICEADLVIPIGCLRPDGALGYLDDAMGLFPNFADEETIRRFRSPSSWLSASHRDRRREEAREAAWLLGVSFTVQIVPAAGDRIFQILAGERDAVFKEGRRVTTNVWDCQVPNRASLVVAALEGGPEQQTWESFARALFASLQVVDDDGAIVVCSDLDDQPGEAMLRIRGVDPDEISNLDELGREVLDESADDALSAAQLVEALRRVRVYLLSRLDDEMVEELGLAPVSRAEEVINLCSRHRSCILMANSQHVLPTLTEDQ